MVGIVDAGKSNLVDLCLQLGNRLRTHAKERVLGEAVLARLKQYGISGELQIYN